MPTEDPAIVNVLENQDNTFENLNAFPVVNNDIPDFELVDILTQIEKENDPNANKQLALTQVQTVEQTVTTLKSDENVANPMSTGKTINFSNVSNVMNRMPLLPTMYFPNSMVNIHYYFKE